ncbi:hypothetical protein E4U47_001976, partial [Claviceps purpurea]
NFNPAKLIVVDYEFKYDFLHIGFTTTSFNYCILRGEIVIKKKNILEPTTIDEFDAGSERIQTNFLDTC